jgi:hypothetical protein
MTKYQIMDTLSFKQLEMAYIKESSYEVE